MPTAHQRTAVVFGELTDDSSARLGRDYSKLFFGSAKERKNRGQEIWKRVQKPSSTPLTIETICGALRHVDFNDGQNQLALLDIIARNPVVGDLIFFKLFNDDDAGTRVGPESAKKNSDICFQTTKPLTFENASDDVLLAQLGRDEFDAYKANPAQWRRYHVAEIANINTNLADTAVSILAAVEAGAEVLRNKFLTDFRFGLTFFSRWNIGESYCLRNATLRQIALANPGAALGILLNRTLGAQLRDSGALSANDYITLLANAPFTEPTPFYLSSTLELLLDNVPPAFAGVRDQFFNEVSSGVVDETNYPALSAEELAVRKKAVQNVRLLFFGFGDKKRPELNVKRPELTRIFRKHPAVFVRLCGKDSDTEAKLQKLLWHANDPFLLICEASKAEVAGSKEFKELIAEHITVLKMKFEEIYTVRSDKDEKKKYQELIVSTLAPFVPVLINLYDQASDLRQRELRIKLTEVLSDPEICKQLNLTPENFQVLCSNPLFCRQISSTPALWGKLKTTSPAIISTSTDKFIVAQRTLDAAEDFRAHVFAHATRSEQISDETAYLLVTRPDHWAQLNPSQYRNPVKRFLHWIPFFGWFRDQFEGEKTTLSGLNPLFARKFAGEAIAEPEINVPVRQASSLVFGSAASVPALGADSSGLPLASSASAPVVGAAPPPLMRRRRSPGSALASTASLSALSSPEVAAHSSHAGHGHGVSKPSSPAPGHHSISAFSSGASSPAPVSTSSASTVVGDLLRLGDLGAASISGAPSSPSISPDLASLFATPPAVSPAGDSHAVHGTGHANGASVASSDRVSPSSPFVSPAGASDLPASQPSLIPRRRRPDSTSGFGTPSLSGSSHVRMAAALHPAVAKLQAEALGGSPVRHSPHASPGFAPGTPPNPHAGRLPDGSPAVGAPLTPIDPAAAHLNTASPGFAPGTPVNHHATHLPGSSPVVGAPSTPTHLAVVGLDPMSPGFAPSTPLNAQAVGLGVLSPLAGAPPTPPNPAAARLQFASPGHASVSPLHPHAAHLPAGSPAVGVPPTPPAVRLPDSPVASSAPLVAGAGSLNDASPAAAVVIPTPPAAGAINLPSSPTVPRPAVAYYTHHRRPSDPSRGVGESRDLLMPRKLSFDGSIRRDDSDAMHTAAAPKMAGQ